MQAYQIVVPASAGVILIMIQLKIKVVGSPRKRGGDPKPEPDDYVIVG